MWQACGGRVQLRLAGMLVAALVALAAAAALMPSAAAAATPVWSSPAASDPAFDQSMFACATAGECIAIGANSSADQYSVFNGSSWSSPADLTDEPRALSCAQGEDFCMEVDSAGKAEIYANGAWGKPQTADSNNAPQTLACASSTFCMVLDAGNGQSTYNGSGWSQLELGPGFIPTDLSCASATLCAAIDNNEGAVWNGSSWSAPATLPESDQATSVSCPAGTSTCVAVDDNGNAYTYTSSGWSAAQQIDSAPLDSVSCVADASGNPECVAIDDYGQSVATANATTAGSWSQPVSDGLVDTGWVSCTSTSFCAALDDVAYTSTSAGPTASSWSAGPTLGSGGYSAVSCAPNGTDCVGADLTGHTVSSNGTTVTAPDNVDPGTPLTSISCPNATTCLAGDSAGNVLTLDLGAAPYKQTLEAGTPILAVSCPVEGFCAALTEAGDVFTTSGSGWSPATKLDSESNGPLALSCASASFCVVTDLDGNAFTYNGSRWSSATSIDSPDNGLDVLSCPTSSFCMAGDLAGNYLTFNGSRWTTPAVAGPEPEELTALTCVSSSYCQVGTVNGIVTYTGSSWARTGTDDDVTSISCASQAYCVAVDADGANDVLEGPPVNTTAPTISGSPQVGATLTAAPGNWTWPGGPIGYSYQWMSCGSAPNVSCTDIAGATGQSYTSAAGLAGKQLEVQVTATDGAGANSADSAPTAAVQTTSAPANTALPKITGTVAVDKTLKASTGTFTGSAPLSYTYQWYLCAKTCAALKGKTASTLKVTTADIGRQIEVAVTATNTGGTKTARSKPTKIVAAPTATLKAWLKPLISAIGKAGRLSQIKKAKLYKATFKPAIAGMVKVSWTTTERVGHKKKTVTVASATLKAKANTKATVKIKLTKAGAKLLKAIKRQKLSAAASFTYAYGTKTKTFKTSRTITVAR